MKKCIIYVGLATLIWWSLFLFGFLIELPTPEDIAMPIPASPYQISSDNQFDLFQKITINNLKAICVNLSGFALSGIPSIVNLAANGFMGGLVVHEALTLSITIEEIIWSILPHSIEFVAFWISGGIGLAGMQISYQLLRHKNLPDWSFIRIVFLFSVLSVCITIVAAALEVYVSTPIRSVP